MSDPFHTAYKSARFPPEFDPRDISAIEHGKKRVDRVLTRDFLIYFFFERRPKPVLAELFECSS